MKILGTDDSVNACDCCGKTGLKSTVVVEIAGEILHYGSTCATRHTGRTAGQILAAVRTAEQERRRAATDKFNASPAAIALAARQALARANGIAPGRTFRDFCADELAAARQVSAEIAAEFKLDRL